MQYTLINTPEPLHLPPGKTTMEDRQKRLEKYNPFLTGPPYVDREGNIYTMQPNVHKGKEIIIEIQKQFVETGSYLAWLLDGTQQALAQKGLTPIWITTMKLSDDVKRLLSEYNVLVRDQAGI